MRHTAHLGNAALGFFRRIYGAISSASLFWAGFSLMDSTLWNQKINYTYKGSILAIQCSSVVKNQRPNPMKSLLSENSRPLY